MSQEPRSWIGQVVSVRQEQWRVLDIARHEGCESWQLEGNRPANRGRRCTLLVPFDRPRLLSGSRRRGRRVGTRRGLLALRAALAAPWPRAGQLRAAAAAAIEILDYQLEPALACLHGAARILVADEVGLGKTIEAGLVLAELTSRGEAERVLVLAPSSLCEQWSDELSSRFRLEPAIVERATLARLAAWSPAGESPWARLPLAVASIDYVKQPEVLRGMEGVRWDLLVVDEAHTCVEARHRAAALDWLSRRARRLLLLTATPHAGDPRAFYALCNVGRFGGDSPVTMFRRTRTGLGARRTRRVRLVRVEVSADEARMHRALLAYATRVWRHGHQGGDAVAARLAMTVLCKRAASGPAALLVSLARRRDLLGRADSAGGVQLALPMDEDPERDDEQPDGVLAARGLADEREERRVLDRLAGLARAASASGAAKTRVLARLLARAHQPALVFTEYRDTLEALAGRLAAVGDVATLHGGLDRETRRAALERFTSGRAAVLLATDAGSLGLNLQAACRLVVNHELPWSPMRLEQRIGRLDRIGQRRTVHAIHLAARGTFEDDVLGRLALRVEAVRRSIGLASSPLGEMGEPEVAAAVIGRGSNAPTPSGRHSPDAPISAGRGRADAPVAPFTSAPSLAPFTSGPSVAPFTPFDRGDLGGEARDEAERLLSLRRLSRATMAGRTGLDLAAVLEACSRGAPWRFTVRARHGGLEPGVYALYVTRVVDGRGALLHEEAFPLFLPASACAAAHSTPPSWPLLAPAFDAVAARVAEAVRSGVEARHRPAIEAQRLRESRMAEIEAHEPPAVQPGLFDRRAVKLAEEAAERREAAAAEAAARLLALGRSSCPELASPPEPLLVFLAGANRRPRWP